MPTTSPAPPTRHRRVRLAQSLAILALVAAAACTSDPPPAPTASDINDAGSTAGTEEEASDTRTPEEENLAPAGAGAGRFDIDQDTTMREVFDTLAGPEQACIREALEGNVLESALDTPLVTEDGIGPSIQSILSCLDPDVAREFFLSVTMAFVVAGAEEEGLDARISEDQEACMRDLLADVDMAALASEPESDDLEEFGMSGLILGLFACIPDLLLASMDDLTREQESCVRDLNAAVIAGDHRTLLESDPELADMLESDPELAGLGPLVGLSVGIFACLWDEVPDPVPADPPPVPSESVAPADGGFDDGGFDDHDDVLDWATPVGVGEVVPGTIDHDGDIDFFVFWAEYGTTYEIDVALGSLFDSTATLYDDGAYELAFNDDYTDNGDHAASRIHWQADYTGHHFVAVEGFADSTGTYTVAIVPTGGGFDDGGFDDGGFDDGGFDDHGDVLDWATWVGVGEAVPGTIDHGGDIDFFVFWAEYGTTYEIDVALGSLPDSTATLYDDGAYELAFNDDYTDNGDHAASRIHWQADYTGHHFVAVEGFVDSTGTYTLTIAVP